MTETAAPEAGMAMEPEPTKVREPSSRRCGES